MNNYRLDTKKYSTHSVISREIGINKVVLDIGCYSGYLGQISSNTNIFYGIDIHKESLVKANLIYKSTALYDLNILKPLPWDIKYDVIVFADVLEHVLLPDNVLKYFVNNYLKNDGLVIISLPNIANFKVRISLLFGKFEYTQSGILDSTHLRLYTYKSALELVEKNGLNIVNVQGGASILGRLIKIIPFTKNLLSTGIILTCMKNRL